MNGQGNARHLGSSLSVFFSAGLGFGLFLLVSFGWWFARSRGAAGEGEDDGGCLREKEKERGKEIVGLATVSWVPEYSDAYNAIKYYGGGNWFPSYDGGVPIYTGCRH